MYVCVCGQWYMYIFVYAVVYVCTIMCVDSYMCVELCVYTVRIYDHLCVYIQ